MRQLSAAGRQAIHELSEQHGFSADAVASMLESVIDGNGSMAQFDHPEFGGSGQWMKGGMTMVADLFNSELKERVNRLCLDLARLVTHQPDLIRSGSFQSQSQRHQQQHSAGTAETSGAGNESPESASLFVPRARDSDEWPADLGRPDSTGAQNGMRYGYFAQAGRLAVEVDGRLTVYDTLDHRIDGVSQQQSGRGSLTFVSQHGPIELANLPVVSANAQQPSARAVSSPASAQHDKVSAAWVSSQHDVFTAIEKLAELYAKGLLTEEEFSGKKTELLSRL